MRRRRFHLWYRWSKPGSTPTQVLVIVQRVGLEALLVVKPRIASPHWEQHLPLGTALPRRDLDSTPQTNSRPSSRNTKARAGPVACSNALGLSVCQGAIGRPLVRASGQVPSLVAGSILDLHQSLRQSTLRGRTSVIKPACHSYPGLTALQSGSSPSVAYQGDYRDCSMRHRAATHLSKRNSPQRAIKLPPRWTLYEGTSNAT